jgi:hypothetical protein
MIELSTVICVISQLWDGDDSPPADYVRVADGKFEAVVTRPTHNDHDVWEERVLGRFDDCKAAVHAIWRFDGQEHQLLFWDERQMRPQ